eukprot:NODE_6_length_70510_cov_1.054395.p13 type:complete len:455 gc:universal NODE_6_length_70510_cov_1.054395:49936-51300(+)
MQFSLTGNDSRPGTHASLMNECVLRPDSSCLLEPLDSISLEVGNSEFRTSAKNISNGSKTLKTFKCAPVFPTDILVKEISNSELTQTFDLTAFEPQEHHVYIPNASRILWITDPDWIIVACNEDEQSYLHIIDSSNLKRLYSVVFEKEILAFDYFKDVKFSNLATVIAVVFKNSVGVPLFGLPLHSRSSVIEISPLMHLNIYPEEKPTSIDCRYNLVAVGYLNGEVALFKLNEIPSAVKPFFHKYTHSSIVSRVHLPVYLGNPTQPKFVISCGLNGKIIYSEFSIKQAHGGIAYSTTTALSNFCYLNFVDGVLFCDTDDTVKFATSFSRTETRRLVTVRSGIREYATSNLHPFIAMGGGAGCLVIHNANQSRVKHGKVYIYSYSYIKEVDDCLEMYMMDNSKLPKDPPQSLRPDGSMVAVQNSGKINALSWSPNPENCGQIAHLGNSVLSIFTL